MDVVVFDLDGTLLDGDSTSHWINGLLLKSPIRTIIAVVALPIIVPMLMSLKLRPYAASFMLWVATFGLSKAALTKSFQAFSENVARKAAKPKWRTAGLSTLENHQRGGARVVIVTAAPEALARALFDAIQLDVEIIGSSLKPSKRGWVGDFHCSHTAKCDRLKALGYGEVWTAVYTDSPDDLPVLKQAKRPIVVNCRRASALRKFHKHVPACEHIEW